MTAQEYIAKPVIVEAWRFDGSTASLYGAVAWVLNNGGTSWPDTSYGEVVIPRVETADGKSSVAHDGDYIVRFESNRFEVLFPEEFEKLYDPKA